VGKGATRAFTPVFDGLWRRARVSVAALIDAEGGNGVITTEDWREALHAPLPTLQIRDDIPRHIVP
jgi:hypothetical protein